MGGLLLGSCFPKAIWQYLSHSKVTAVAERRCTACTALHCTYTVYSGYLLVCLKSQMLYGAGVCHLQRDQLCQSCWWVHLVPACNSLASKLSALLSLLPSLKVPRAQASPPDSEPCQSGQPGQVLEEKPVHAPMIPLLKHKDETAFLCLGWPKLC
jgi:hypothetical protein